MGSPEELIMDNTMPALPMSPHTGLQLKLIAKQTQHSAMMALHWHLLIILEIQGPRITDTGCQQNGLPHPLLLLELEDV